MIPRAYDCGPLYIGRRNAEAATGLLWRHLRELMLTAGYRPITVGSKTLFRGADVAEMLELAAAEAAPMLAEQSDAQVLVEMRRGLGRELRRVG